MGLWGARRRQKQLEKEAAERVADHRAVVAATRQAGYDYTGFTPAGRRVWDEFCDEAHFDWSMEALGWGYEVDTGEVDGDGDPVVEVLYPLFDGPPSVGEHTLDVTVLLPAGYSTPDFLAAVRSGGDPGRFAQPVDYGRRVTLRFVGTHAVGYAANARVNGAVE